MKLFSPQIIGPNILWKGILHCVLRMGRRFTVVLFEVAQACESFLCSFNESRLILFAKELTSVSLASQSTFQVYNISPGRKWFCTRLLSSFFCVEPVGSTSQGILGSSNPPQLNAPFQFQAATNQINTNATPPLGFAGNAPSFNFSAAAGGQGSSSSTGAGNAQPPAPFVFGGSTSSGPGASTSGNNNQGFKFSLGTPSSFNFAPNMNTNMPNFSGGSASDVDISKRVIKKATRRKK